MAEVRTGSVVVFRKLSPILAVFRLMPEEGKRFPEYKAGQHIALRREDCKLTTRVVGPDGEVRFVPLLDDAGRQKRGPMTHSYSIASAPFETRASGHLEFYVVEERDEAGNPGRLTESLMRISPPSDVALRYVDRIVGDFTLDRRGAGSTSLVFVGTGTGLVPFVAMLKQLHFEAETAGKPSVSYTLLHTNRTRPELAYHEELLQIEASGRLDFVYVPTVSRPTSEDAQDVRLGRGRANNVLRLVFGMPLKEEEQVAEARAKGDDTTAADRALQRAIRPALPAHLSADVLRQRLDPSRTAVLTCGNPSLMADIKDIADTQKLRFEKEDW